MTSPRKLDAAFSVFIERAGQEQRRISVEIDLGPGGLMT